MDDPQVVAARSERRRRAAEPAEALRRYDRERLGLPEPKPFDPQRRECSLPLAYLVPVKEDEGEETVTGFEHGPTINAEGTVDEFNQSVREARRMQKTRFSRFAIRARAVGQPVRCQTRARERRPRPVRRRGCVSKRAGPLPKPDDPDLATSTGATR